MDTAPQTMVEWKSYLNKSFGESNIMVLATVDGAKPWVSPVCFGHDESFVVYFISKPTSRHMRHIENNQAVAYTIYDEAQDPRERVHGIQVAGAAHLVTSPEARRAFDAYFTPTNTRTPVMPSGGPLAYVTPDAQWRMVKIIPEAIECFDERISGGGKLHVPESLYKTV